MEIHLFYCILLFKLSFITLQQAIHFHYRTQKLEHFMGFQLLLCMSEPYILFDDLFLACMYFRDILFVIMTSHYELIHD